MAKRGAFELVEVDLSNGDEELKRQGSWSQMIRDRDNAIADHEVDYEDGRYPYLNYRIQPAK